MSKNWVDLQVNGHRGVDFTSPDLSEQGVVQVIEELAEAGTAVFLPTIITASDELYARNVPLIKRTVEKYGLQKHVPGVHLEGPLLTCAGAHDPKLQQKCSAENVRKIYDLSEGFIKIMTLSAEAPGSPEAIAEMKTLGIIPSTGHHTAGYADIHRAADAGCQLLTHLGNACPNLVGRHENPLLAGLAEERMKAMIITDGHHLPPDLIKIIFKVKGSDNVIVTSDACSLCGFPPGEYALWGNRAVLTPEGKLHDPDKQCLVAAAATMDMCMEFLKQLDFLTDEELLKAGRTNALKLLGLENSL